MNDLEKRLAEDDVRFREGLSKLLYCLCSGCVAASIATIDNVETAGPYFFLGACIPAMFFIWAYIRK